MRFIMRKKKEMDEESQPNTSNNKQYESKEAEESRIQSTEDKAVSTKKSQKESTRRKRNFMDRLRVKRVKKNNPDEFSQESNISNIEEKIGNYEPNLSQIKETMSFNTSKPKSGKMDEENEREELKRNNPESIKVNSSEKSFSIKSLKRARDNSNKQKKSEKGQKVGTVKSNKAVMNEVSDMTEKVVDIESAIEAADGRRKKQRRINIRKVKKTVVQSVPPKTKKGKKEKQEGLGKRSKSAKKKNEDKKRVDYGIPKAPFKALLKSVIREENPQIRITDQAFHLLKTVSENFLVNMFSKMNNITTTSKRKTLMIRDARTYFRNLEHEELVFDHIGGN